MNDGVLATGEVVVGRPRNRSSPEKLGGFLARFAGLPSSPRQLSNFGIAVIVTPHQAQAEKSRGMAKKEERHEEPVKRAGEFFVAETALMCPVSPVFSIR